MSKKKESTIVSEKIPTRMAFIIIASLSVLIYLNTLNHGFVLDDTAVIENNKFVKEGVSAIPKLLTTFYWQGYWNSNAGLYRPLSLIMFAAEYQISPNNPFIHHFINVALYALICCLLFRLLCKWFSEINPFFFLCVTLLFVVHPIHTEVIANIKSRDEILALLFFLLCCNYLYAEQKKLKIIVLSTLFFLLSLLSKEGAITFLPIIFIFDYIRKKNVVVILKDRIPLIITTVVWYVWHQHIINSASSQKIVYTYNDNSLIAASSIIEQKATAFGMFFRYIIKVFYPYQLSYDYSFNQVPIIQLLSPLALLGIIFLLILVFIIIRYLWELPLLSISTAFILFPLLLTSNIFFNIGSTMADRFLFVSTIGSCILTCWLIFKLFKIDLSKNIKSNNLNYCMIALLLFFSVKTFARNSDWKSNFTLFEKDVTVATNSARAHYNHGTALMNKANATAKDSTDSQKEFENCLNIDSQYPDALTNLGVIYTRRKNYASALQLYRKALAIDKNSGTLYGNMGDIFFRTNQPDSVIFYLENAHRLGNHNVESYNLLGAAQFSKKEYEQACKTFAEGLALDSTNWNLYLNYGNALAVSSRYNEAITALNKSYQLNPNNTQTLYFIAITYNKIGDTLNANKYYSEFKKFNPN